MRYAMYFQHVCFKSHSCVKSSANNCLSQPLTVVDQNLYNSLMVLQIFFENNFKCVLYMDELSVMPELSIRLRGANKTKLFFTQQ